MLTEDEKKNPDWSSLGCLSVDIGLIRTDASEENRFLVYRVRPLRHNALSD
jgi:hypothetical protein